MDKEKIEKVLALFDEEDIEYIRDEEVMEYLRMKKEQEEGPVLKKKIGVKKNDRRE